MFNGLHILKKSEMIKLSFFALIVMIVVSGFTFGVDLGITRLIKMIFL